MRSMHLTIVFAAAIFGCAQAQASPCKLSTAELKDVAALEHPVTKGLHGNYMQNGAALSDDDRVDLCTTRKLYDLIVAAQAKGRLIAANEITYYVPLYLTASELKRTQDYLAEVIAAPLQDPATRRAIVDAWKRANEPEQTAPSPSSQH
jgi:N-acyl-D-aspartate/D-glutamate deacylase